MRRSTWYRWLLAASVLTACLVATPGRLQAVEESQRFLEGLRERRMYDTALEYLEQMRTSPLASQEFKALIDYEAGVTLIDSSRMGRVASVRQEQLDQAQTSLAKFLQEHADHPMAPGANTRLADVLVERGRIEADQAQRPNVPPAESKRLLEQARTLYQEAEKVLGTLEEQFLEAHRQFPKIIDPKDTRQIEARDQVRRDLLQARLARATVVYEIAHTHEPGSKGNADNLRTAAERYKDLYTKYGSRLAGLYAHLWEARCYKELGKTDEAMEAFEDLLAQPDEPQAFRTLKSQTLILLLETALAAEEDKLLPTAVEKYGRWAETSRGAEEASEDGLTIKYRAGEVYFRQGRAAQKPADQQKTYTEARKLFQYVADRPGDYQQQARSMLRRKELAGEEIEVPEPTNFAEARDRGKDTLDQMQGPELKPDEVARLRDEAIKYFRMAVALRTPEVTVDEMNVVRYYLSYLYFLADDLYEAAVVGEFLAHGYSESPGARQAAKIAMAAYVKLFNEAPPDDRQWESQRMVGIADYITKRWAGEPEADEAWMMLIRTALSEGDLERAREYLAKLSPDSGARGEAELMTGQKLWGNYLQAAAQEEGQRPPQAELDKMVAQARETLENGVAGMRKVVDDGGDVSYTLMASVLSLAQISIDAGDAEKALAWLNDPKIGALTLTRADHPATDRGNFRVETYKAALRAFVATQQLEQAEDVMKALEALIQTSGDADAGGTLTRIYISLGRELQNQLERLRKEGKTEQLDKVASGFELFLDRISQRQQGNTFNSLNWVAETFFGLGAGFDPGGGTLPAKAKSYYEKSAETYRKILELCKQKKLDCRPGAPTSIKIRLAGCLRRLGQVRQARDMLAAMLKERPTMIDAQLEAAYTYQTWGQQDPAAYLLAMQGSKQHPEIWGWGRIAQRVARSEKHQAIFHEARYNLALCRFKLAVAKSGAEKQSLLQRAENDIVIVQRLYPKMGGSAWYGKYDELLKNIQKLRGKTPGGLKATAASK